MTEDGVPVALRRLWGLSVASRLGRPAELDVAQVVSTAVDLADRDGLAGATLPKVAAALGYTTMSLYRYIGSKDELLVLMADAGTGEPPTIAAPDWRTGLRQWARELRLLDHRRPWLARIPTSGPPAGPHRIAWMETGLGVLRGTGLDWAAKVGVLTLLSGYVRHTTLLAQDLATGREGTGLAQAQAEERYGRSLLALIDPDRFPETAKLFASGVFAAPALHDLDDPTADPDFVFGLERILDGIEVALSTG